MTSTSSEHPDEIQCGTSKLSLDEAASESSRSNMCDQLHQRTLDVIEEDGDNGSGQQPQCARAKRANMVKKALTYFSDKSNRSVSEDNLYTRRKNLAVHLGLDEKIGIREIQKINTYCLPVPATTFEEVPEPTTVAAEVEVVNEDMKVKDLVRFLGIKDGFTASMASQGTLSDEAPDGNLQQQLQAPQASQRRSRSFEIQGKVLERSMTECGEQTKSRDKRELGRQKKH